MGRSVYPYEVRQTTDGMGSKRTNPILVCPCVSLESALRIARNRGPGFEVFRVADGAVYLGTWTTKKEWKP
jgi:hypothetical protein